MRKLRISTKAWLASFMLAPMLATGAFSATAAAQTDTAIVAASEETIPADAFISGLVDKLRIIAARDDADETKTEDLRAVLGEDIATKRLQFFLLSTKQRSELSEEDIMRYDGVFQAYITSAFAASIDDLVSRDVKINDVLERRPGDYIVRSKLYSDDGKARANLDWRVLESKGDKQLVDVMIDGLSFTVERRAQFTSILNKDGFDALVAHMQEIAGDEADAGAPTGDGDE